MVNTLNIYEIGTKVKLNDDDLVAKIVTVAIHASNGQAKQELETGFQKMI